MFWSIIAQIIRAPRNEKPHKHCEICQSNGKNQIGITLQEISFNTNAKDFCFGIILRGTYPIKNKKTPFKNKEILLQICQSVKGSRTLSSARDIFYTFVIV